MSDTFDHELDAFESLIDDRPEVEIEQENPKDEGWTCSCGKWHPKNHRECYYCNK